MSNDKPDLEEVEEAIIGMAMSAVIGKRLIECEVQALVDLLKSDLDDGLSWDEALVKGLLAVRAYSGALSAALEVKAGVEEVQTCRDATRALFQVTGGMEVRVQEVLTELRAHEQHVRTSGPTAKD